LDSLKYTEDQKKVQNKSDKQIQGWGMVGVLVLSTEDRGFESRSSLNKDYITGICCFSASYLFSSCYSRKIVHLAL